MGLRNSILAISFVLAATLTVYSIAIAQTSEESNALTLTIIDVKVAKKIPAFLSEGGAGDTNISEPPSGGTPKLMMLRGRDGKLTTVTAGYATAPEGRHVLKATCVIKNTSDKPESFKVGDMCIVIDSKPHPYLLAAVGMGRTIYLKMKRVALNAVKKKGIEIKPKSTCTISYAFSLEDKSLSAPLALSLAGAEPIPITPPLGAAKE